MYIGIDRNHDLMYEGNWPYGRALWPAPIVTPAKIVFPSDGELKAESAGDSIFQQSRFREDHFDPIARVRRGRFYFGDGVNSQPSEWRVRQHPGTPADGGMPRHEEIKKPLETFVSGSVPNKYPKMKREQPLVLLGSGERFTIWMIINIEVISTGEDLVTLKARNGLGVLPQIFEDKIPQEFRARVLESLNTFADDVHRSSPTSVIDRARDAASQMLLAYYNASGKDAKDLGHLAKRLLDGQFLVAGSAANIIARLHSRAKPSERERQDMRAIREQDAELAVQCVGTMLCELQWADWP